MAAPQVSTQAVASWIETMVRAKPRAFCSASALPMVCGWQAAADSAENCGESATTTTPQASNRASAHPAETDATSG